MLKLRRLSSDSLCTRRSCADRVRRNAVLPESAVRLAEKRARKKMRVERKKERREEGERGWGRVSERWTKEAMEVTEEEERGWERTGAGATETAAARVAGRRERTRTAEVERGLWRAGSAVEEVQHTP